MENKKVSIIIPCFNQAQYLPDSVESVLQQTYKNIELIIVNDGSTDHTKEIAKELSYNVLINQDNKGLSVARNEGIRCSTGEYILPLDADDKISPDFIEKTIGKNDIVSTWQQEFGLSNRLWMNTIVNPTYENFRQRNQINCCALFKKEIWENIGGYDENMLIGFEDWDFWLRATKANYKVSVIPEALFYYRKHGPSMVNEAIKNQSDIKKYMIGKGSL
jgi:glycosyltransferase involved in cell wall biosynthesis